MRSELEDARGDLDYCHGFNAGWNAGYQAGAEAERRRRDAARYGEDDSTPSWVASLWRSMRARHDAALDVVMRARRAANSER